MARSNGAETATLRIFTTRNAKNMTKGTKRIETRVISLRSLFLCFLFSLSVFCAEFLSAEIEWPKITSQTKPWSRWWWLGNIVNKEDLSSSMEKYQKAGLGGLEITPIYGVKGYEDRFIDYLSPAWLEMLDHSLKEASRLGLGVDMATGTGWPFGGPWVGADDSCRNVVHKIYNLKGGESLSEPIVHLQKPLVRAIGRRVAIAELKEPISANRNLQALALDQVRFEKKLSPHLLIAYSDKGETLDLTDKVDSSGKLSWVAPGGSGNWTLYALFQGWHGKMVERAGPGGEGNVIDHFSDQALKNYLKKFDQAFTGRDIKSLRAFFNDSYEVDDAEGESNWTPDFLAEFQRRRGYDLRGHLPALFGNDTDEKNARVRCDYRETISELLLDEFTIPWRQWAAGKGAVVRNQSHGSPANILDLYAASDIPETEGSDIHRIKFASSAANVTGKPLTSSESATWLNEHFVSTLGDVKGAIDRFFLGGVNHIFYHGTPYSPASEEWPGLLFYAAVHFGPSNSFWKDFASLNRYVARCQSFLQSGRPDHDALLYYPIYDSWSNTGQTGQPGQTGKNLLVHFGQGIEGAMTQSAGHEMLKTGYTYDLVSDRQLEKVEVAGNSIRTGGNSYKVVVLPECRFIPLKTFDRLVELARRGATIIVQNSLPSDVSGWGNLDGRRSDFKRLVAGLQFAKVSGAEIQSAKAGSGRFLLGKDLGQLLSFAGIKRESLVDRGLQFVRRKYDKGRYYFILNSGNEPFEGWIPLQAGARSVAVFNPMLEEKGMAEQRRSETGANEFYLQLAPGESCILKTFQDVVKGPVYGYFNTKGEANKLAGAWSVKFVEGGPELPGDVETRELGSWTGFGGEAVKRFSGTARYTLSFEQPKGEADGWLLDLGRVCESARVSINGKELGTLINSPYRVRIPRALLREKNTIEIDVSNLMANRIADLDRRNMNWKRFYNINFPSRRPENRGADGLFNASQWLPRDSGLIGPVTLVPVEAMKVGK
jgi:alpha-L-rhamnosidase